MPLLCTHFIVLCNYLQLLDYSTSDCCIQFVSVITMCLFIYFVLSPPSFLRNHCRCRGLLLHVIIYNDTRTLGRTPLDKGSVCPRGLYLQQHSQETNIHDPGGIRNLSPSKRAAVGLIPPGSGLFTLVQDWRNLIARFMIECPNTQHLGATIVIE